jgi:hypothetical protein
LGADALALAIVVLAIPFVILGLGLPLAALVKLALWIGSVVLAAV